MPELRRAGVLTFEEARTLVESHAARIVAPGTELIDLTVADGRTLAQELLADRDFPPFPRATRDGFAVRAGNAAQVPAELKVVGEIAAGKILDRSIEAGEAAEIMTGAPLPEGADAVVMVEYTRRSGDRVVLERAAHAGDNFVAQGAEARSGALLLPRGTRLNPAVIAIAASVGADRIAVYQRPRISIVSTGDELVDVVEKPGPSQIRNSNSYSIAAQVARAGGTPQILPIAHDSAEAIDASLKAASTSELLILSGGVSMGKYDLVEQVLEGRGARFEMTGAKIQPGKPVVFGLLPTARGELPFFGLPGNPISTMVTFDLFVEPLLGALCGRTVRPLRFAHAKLAEAFRTSPGLTRFLPAIVSGNAHESQVAVVPWHGSGDLAAIVKANGYLVVLPEETELAAGSLVSVLLKD